MLATGGAWALFEARTQSNTSPRVNVSSPGDVVDRSAGEAEGRARSWSLVGAALLAGAAASGIAATVMFVQDQDSGNTGAGVTVSGSF